MKTLAQHLLSSFAMVGTFAIATSISLLAGCPVPFPSDVEETPDAGLNNTPFVERATPDELGFPGPLFIDRADERVVTLHIRDTDLGDTLHVRVFREYGKDMMPTPYLANVEIPPTGTVERLRDISLSTWCAGLPDGDQELKVLAVFVADRAFLDCSVAVEECMSQPQFRELPASTQWSTREWLISCNPLDN